jgi:hypothetical protein
MAHFCLLVAAAERDGAREALLPFWNDDREGHQQPHFIFVEDQHADVDSTTGRRGYWRNPIGKWDGWTFGGNWHGLLGIETDILPAREVHRLVRTTPAIFADVHATLRDGQWRDADEFKPKYANRWCDEVHRFVEETPANFWIAVIDCHC